MFIITYNSQDMKQANYPTKDEWINKMCKYILWDITQPGGSGWGDRWERGSGWGRHVNPRPFQFNV